jgi:hypothetical protein
MANVVYTSLLNSILNLNPSIDFDTDTIKVAMVTSAYTPSAAHQFFSSVTGVVGTPQTLTTPSVTAGVFDAADATFTAVTAGSTVVGLVLYKDTGVAGTSPLIAFIDSVASGLPVATNGGNIVIAWDNGANKILKVG